MTKITSLIPAAKALEPIAVIHTSDTHLILLRVK